MSESKSRSESGSKQRQPDGKRGPLALGALKLNLAAVQFHAALHDEQTKAGAWNLTHVAASMEGLKQSVLIRLRDAASMINNAADCIVSVAADREVNRRAGWRVFHSV